MVGYEHLGTDFVKQEGNKRQRSIVSVFSSVGHVVRVVADGPVVFGLRLQGSQHHQVVTRKLSRSFI